MRDTRIPVTSSLICLDCAIEEVKFVVEYDFDPDVGDGSARERMRDHLLSEHRDRLTPDRRVACLRRYGLAETMWQLRNSIHDRLVNGDHP